MTPKNNKPSETELSDGNQPLLRFAAMLNIELDRLGYPDRPRRAGQLASDLGIVRTSAYTILKGIGMPSNESITALRRLGVSIDRLMDAYWDTTPKRIHLQIGTATLAVDVRDNAKLQKASVVRMQVPNGAFQLKVIPFGNPVPDGGIPVTSIDFLEVRTVALLDDDEDIRVTIAEGLKREFHVVPFSSSHDLLKYKGLDNFAALLVDWRLPNDTVVGVELIGKLRSQTSAPIFIMTGDMTAGQAIANVMTLKDVHHVGKPLDIYILAKRIETAVRSVE